MAKPVLIVQVFPPLHDGREWWPVFLGGKKTKMLLWLGIVVRCVRVSLAIKTGRVMRDAHYREPDATTDTFPQECSALPPTKSFG